MCTAVIWQRFFVCPYTNNSIIFEFSGANFIAKPRQNEQSRFRPSFSLNQSTITNPVKEFYRKKAITNDNDEEDFEIVIAKKNLEKTTYFTSFFNQQATHFISYYTKNSFAFRKEFSYLPSYQSLYIIFEVFRI